jgi:FtsP/CotA-like multicopper oxidase with cupredoxin domain
LEGVAEIWGTVDMSNFWYYKVEFAEGADPAEGDWHWVGDGKDRTINGYLATWNTFGLSPGVYSLRLVVVDITGNTPPMNICQLQLSI